MPDEASGAAPAGASAGARTGKLTAADEWAWLGRIRRPQGRKGEVFADLLTDFPEKFAQRRRLWLLQEPAASGVLDQGTALQAAEKGIRSWEKCQGTTSVVPQTPQNKRRALQATEKLAALKGHDFSRAVSTAESSRPLGPEGCLSGGLPAIPPFSATSLAPEAQLPAASPVAFSPRAVELVAHWPHKGGMVLHFAGVDSISAAEALAGLIVAVPRAERAALGEDEAYIGDLIGCKLVDVAAGGTGAVIGEIEDVDRTAGPVAMLIVRGAAGEILIPFAKSYLRRIDLDAKRVEMALPEGLVDLNS